jgi:hypothetical protein
VLNIAPEMQSTASGLKLSVYDVEKGVCAYKRGTRATPGACSALSRHKLVPAKHSTLCMSPCTCPQGLARPIRIHQGNSCEAKAGQVEDGQNQPTMKGVNRANGKQQICD